jgi:hypothetical protein
LVKCAGGVPSDFWGKVDRARQVEPNGIRWLITAPTLPPFCEALLEPTLVRRRLARLGQRVDLNRTDIQRLAPNKSGLIYHRIKAHGT